MKIAIIGHGNVGGTLARKWAAAGHHIAIGARHPDDDKVQKILSFYQGIRAAYCQRSRGTIGCDFICHTGNFSSWNHI